MTYAELFHAVLEHLDDDESFAIEVQTWSHAHDGKRGEPDTTWTIYVHERGVNCEGPTAMAAFQAFVGAQKRSLEDTSEAVGGGL